MSKSKRPEYKLWLRAKQRAKERGIFFDLKLEDIVIPKYCPILGIELKKTNNRDTSPSLDRYIPELGYVPGNIAVISNRANQIKSNANLQELKRLVSWLEQA